MSLNPGKIRIFLIFKSQNFLIEKKIFALRAKIFRAQQEKIFFCCCRPAVRGGHIFLPTTVPYPRIGFQDFWGQFVFPPRCFSVLTSEDIGNIGNCILFSFCGAKGITQNGAAGEKIIGYGVKCSFSHYRVSQRTLFCGAKKK